MGSVAPELIQLRLRFFLSMTQDWGDEGKDLDIRRVAAIFRLC